MADLTGVKAIFSTPKPKLVLAVYRSAIGDAPEKTEAVSRLRDLVKAKAAEQKIEFHEWTLPLAPKNGTPTTSPSANIFQRVLGIENVHTAAPPVVPALLAVNDGKLLDVLKGQEEVSGKAEEFISKFGAHLKQKKNPSLSPQQKVGIFAVDPAQPTAATIDVEKLVSMGQDMMRKGQAVYAEKFFAKAIGVLDTVGGQVDASEGGDSDLEGSVAMTLAWLAISQIVQNGRNADQNAACDRLEKDFAGWITPLSDASRAIALRALARYLPAGAEWSGATCSTKKITEELLEISAVANAEAAKAKAEAEAAKKQKTAEEGAVKTTSDDETKKATTVTPLADRVATLRSLLVITYFLQGDLERSVTEAIKLHVMRQPYGTTAMDALVAFMGEDHTLVTRSGWLAIKSAGI